MSWRKEYEIGSFRGATFRTAGHERSGGRRVAIHEFPSRDEPLVEDLGRKARQFSIECHVIGSDYRGAREALLSALEDAGPGLLIHPWHGRMMVVALDYTSSESTDEGGVCWFQITFGEAGLPVAAPIGVSAGGLAGIEADAQLAKAPGLFAGKFSIASAAGFVESAAGRLIGGIATISQVAAGLQGGIGPALRAFDAGLRFLPDNLGRLLRDPLALGSSLVGLVQAVALLAPAGSNSRGRAKALTTMLDWVPADPDFPDRTASRRLEADNHAALLQLFRSATAAELVRTAAAMPFASYDDAIATRDAVTVRLDALAVTAADRGDDAGAEVFDRLRRAVARDLVARGATLARVYSFELEGTAPALALANRLYGSDDLEARAAAIVARNHVVHPGFVPGGRAIELLTAT